MARNWYGGTAADYATTPSGRLLPGARYEVWNARYGGSRITDLLDENGAACTLVTASASGLILYQGPDSDRSVHYLQPVGGGSRTAVTPLGLDPIATSSVDYGQLVAGAAGVFDVRKFGAVGDGVVNDTAAIQAAIDAAAGDAPVVFPAGTYRITDWINVDGGSVLRGHPGAVISQVTAGKGALSLTGSDITIQGLSLTGRHATSTYVAYEHGIRTYTTYDAPLSNIRIADCVMSGWGAYGLFLDHVRNFRVTGCTVDQIGYCGIAVLSAIVGEISGCQVSNVTAGAGGNSYGIAVSRSDTTNDAHPLPTDVVVRGNSIHNCRWEGFDTHGGIRIVFDGNTVTNCDQAVAIGSDRNAAGDWYYPPTDVIVSSNIIDAQVADGTLKEGILFTGVTGVSKATGAITGNVIRGHGSSGRTGGIHAKSTQGLVIANNVISEPYAYGVVLPAENYGLVMANNTFVDVWSEGAAPAAITAAATATGIVMGNRLTRGTKTATKVNELGLYDFGGSAAGVALVETGNDFSAATTPFFCSSGVTDVATRVGHATTRLGFYGAAGIVKPTVVGSRNRNAALESLLTALAGMGLIADNSIGGNVLTANQASVETDTTGFAASTNCGAISRTTSTAYVGSASLLVPQASGTYWKLHVTDASLTAWLIANAGRVVTMQARIKAGGGTTTSAQIGLRHDGANSDGSSVAINTNGFTLVQHTLTLPTISSEGRIQITPADPTGSGSVYVDAIGLWLGGSSTWVMPGE